MMYQYLTNTFVYLIVGGALLLVWRRHASQDFTRDLGGSTIAASLVPMGFMLHQSVPSLEMLGTFIVLCGAIPNLLFLCSGVLRLAGRRLPLGTALAMVAGMMLVLTVPTTEQRIWMWPTVNMLFLCSLGVMAGRWMWQTSVIERLVGPLLVLLGLNQLPLILYSTDGLEVNLFGATVLRAAMGCVFLFAALERAANEIGKLGARFQLLTEHSLQGIVVTDGERVLYANPAAQTIYGRSVEPGTQPLLSEIPPGGIDAGLLQRIHRQLQERLLDSANWDGPRVLGGKERELRFAAWRIDWDGVPATQILITDDTERNASARALLYKATHDELTGLPNRTLLMERLNTYCADGHCSLVIINIDRFKLFNQSQGHETGDHVLKAFSAKLLQTLGPRAELMRLGGDEFAIVDPEQQADRELSWRLHSACRQALVVPGGEYFIDASMGMAICPDHGSNGEALLRAAISAMYQAKRTPGTSLAMAERRFEQMSAQALEQEQALRKGIRNHELFLQYQPKVDGNGQLRGLEALARWQRPGVGLVSPIDFIGIAEDTGLIAELGAMLLLEACRQIAQWRSEAGDCVPVAVNVSPVQLLSPGFLLLVEDALQRYEVPARYLTLEITESAAVDNLEDTRHQLVQLRELGVNIAMDDFGTGFSSLSMLRELPLNVVKIDRGLIAPLPAADAVAVVTAICRLAAALELEVVAEGIETAGQAQAALTAGCHELQGFFYARPMMPDDALLWLRRTFDVVPAPQASTAP